MIITVASFKGGVGKTTTAAHLAAYFQEDAPTLLVDGDPNRSATNWAGRGRFPFRIVDEHQAIREVQKYSHAIIDTKARPEPEDFKSLAAVADLLIIPTPPSALDIDALMLTIGALKELGCQNFRVLLSIVPRAARSGRDTRQVLAEAGIPTFQQDISALEAFRAAALTGDLVRDVTDQRAQRAWEEYGEVYKEVRGLL